MDRIDQALARGTVQQQAARANLAIAAPQTTLDPIDNDKRRRDLLLGGALREYDIREFKMDTARSDEEVPVDGDFIHAAVETGSLTGVGLRLNTKDSGLIYLNRRNPVSLRFFKLYLTHPAQAGATLDLMIGREASASAMTATVDVTISQVFQTLSSDKDTHFTTALATGALEVEDLTGLTASKIRITGIVIQADQPLDFYLVFFNKGTHDDDDLDVDSMCGIVRLNMATHAIRRPTGKQYYLSLEDVNLDYQDEDGSQELHVGLYNNDTTSKSATTTGEVAIQFKYEVRT